MIRGQIERGPYGLSAPNFEGFGYSTCLIRRSRQPGRGHRTHTLIKVEGRSKESYTIKAPQGVGEISIENFPPDETTGRPGYGHVTGINIWGMPVDRSTLSAINERINLGAGYEVVYREDK